MKRIRIAGLCLVAVFAFGALAASSASAFSPEQEYKNCVKVAKTPDPYEKVKAATTHAEVRMPEVKEIYEGKYSDKLCSELAPEPGPWDGTPELATEAPSLTSGYFGIEYKGPEGKYERETVAEETPFESKSKTAVLTVAGKTITCKKDTDKGFFLSGRFSFTEEIVFSKCELPSTTETVHGHAKTVKHPCNSPGEVAGTIKTKQLVGYLEYLSNVESETELVIELEGYEGTFMEIECTGGLAAVAVKGGVVGTVTNTTKGVTLTFAVEEPSKEQKVQTFWVEGHEQSEGPIHLYTAGDRAAKK